CARARGEIRAAARPPGGASALMCHESCIDFVASRLSAEEIQGSDVLEVGSRDVNGSVRPVVERARPASYLGVDIEAGPGVGERPIKTLEPDPTRPGVFLKAQKPRAFEPAELQDVALYSIIRQERVLDVTDEEAQRFKPPFSVVDFLWSLLPERIRTDGFRPVLRQLLHKS